MGLGTLILFADLLIQQLISKKLEGVIVVAEQLVISIDLISKSAFLDSVNGTAPSFMSSTGVLQ